MTEVSCIDLTWEDYFTNPDEGMGTTYERFILHRVFERVTKRHKVRKVLEVPAFGMTGISDINSIWWAQRGAAVTVGDHDRERLRLAERVWRELGLVADFVCHDAAYAALPFSDAVFDMSWNFAALWYVGDLENFLSELTRVTRRVVLLCVPNRLGIGFLAQRYLTSQSPTRRAANVDPRRIRSGMANLGWRSEEQGYFDVPPWPDIAMKKEDLLRKIGLAGVLRVVTKAGAARVPGILDYYSGRSPDMERNLMRYAFLEDSPWVLKRIWAHHEYVLFARR